LPDPSFPRPGVRQILTVAAGLLVALWLGAAAPTARASTVIVQGTTDVRDAGLLEDVIVPGFEAAYPQYTLKYIAVGTGQAITNAKAGQGDALLTHAPTLEKAFVEEGFSLDPRGRAVFYSDYVIPGPLDDPAGVLSGAPHNAVHAFELIAKAGGEGKANFVSRGDNSGTNTQEKAIWKLTSVELNKKGEPGPAGTEETAPWYQKAGLGQAETVLLAQQCPFTGGGCYEMTDRGTFNRLVSNGSVSELEIVAQDNEASAPGGINLLTNPFTAYVVNPAKVPSANVEGAKAFLDYLTSEALQSRLASYPNTISPAFFADAHPRITVAQPISGTLRPGAAVAVSGTVASLLPGAPPVAGQTILLQRADPVQPPLVPTYTTIATSTTGADGSYALRAAVNRGGDLQVELPTTASYPPLNLQPLIAVGSLSRTDLAVGRVSVRAAITLRRPRRQGQVVVLRGRVDPAAEPDSGATLVILGRQRGSHKLRALRKVRASRKPTYKVHVKLGSGQWKLRVRYRDPGAVLPATSRAVSVSVP
jgi:tungstate transport system substrate-binding protein